MTTLVAAEVCDHCGTTGGDLRVIGGLTPGRIPLHAHTLHSACVGKFARARCSKCCSVITSAKDKETL